MQLEPLIEQLSAFPPSQFPVISLYLNAQPDQHGRDSVDAFVRKEFKMRARTWPEKSAERESFERDAARIRAYIQMELKPSANSVAIFACAAENDFFQAVQLDTPIDEHRLYVYRQPHLYALARMNDQYPRYAALIADTNYARILVFGLRQKVSEQEFQGVKTRGSDMGGWAQARYQRHIENYHQQHVREVVGALDEIVRRERIRFIVIAGDDKAIPIVQRELPKDLADKVVDFMHLDVDTPDSKVLDQTLSAMRRHDAITDAEKTQRLLDEYRAGGLAVVGPKQTLAALTIGQADEVLVSAGLDRLEEEVEVDEDQLAAMAAGAEAERGPSARVALLPAELVAKAGQTGAKVIFIEDQALLAPVGGVGALLRYRISS